MQIKDFDCTYQANNLLLGAECGTGSHDCVGGEIIMILPYGSV